MLFKGLTPSFPVFDGSTRGSIRQEGQPPEWIARLKVVPAPPAPSSSPAAAAAVARRLSAYSGRWDAEVPHRSATNGNPGNSRPQNEGEIVAMARDIEGGGTLKAQPRDRRLPALWLLHPEITPGVASVQSELMKRDERREAAREAATVARQQSLSHEALSKALQDGSRVVKFRDWFRPETSALHLTNIHQFDALLEGKVLGFRPDESLSPRADLVEAGRPTPTRPDTSSGRLWSWWMRLVMGEKALLDLLKDADVDAADASSQASSQASSSEVSHSCVVMGPAGAGKTTLVNVLGGVDFPTGPQASDRTLEAQSCDLKLQDVVEKVVLIDTPGWSPDTNVDIESEYQQVLKEKKLVSEHAPHIVLFCVSASNIRQFQHEDAKKMGGQLTGLKFDQRFCIKVLPIVTFADTQAQNDLDKIMPEIKNLVETVFEHTCSTVEEPVFTMAPPNEEAQGVDMVKGRLTKMLLDQVKAEESSDRAIDSASETSSFTKVSDPDGSPGSSESTAKTLAPLENEIPALLAQITKQAKKGFQDTRVLEAQPTFVEDVTKLPFQLILNHSCLVLGPAGAGKTTLVNHLGGVQFETGPRECHRTSHAQSCDLKLENVTEKLKVVLIDTPGWSPDTRMNLKSEYQQVLKEKKLVSEHSPHIVLFCVSASNIRQFQHKDAKKMGHELQKLKFDKSFCIKVLPVVTFADTQAEKELEDIMSEITKHVKTAFKSIDATVEEPVATRVPTDGEAQGVEEVKSCLRKMLLDQVQSDDFSHLWRLAFANGIVSQTKQHATKFPSNDSALRLFQRAFCTVAAGCGKEVSDSEAFEEIAASLAKCDQLEDSPWSTIQRIPDSHTKICLLPQFLCRSRCIRTWSALLIAAIMLFAGTLHTWDIQESFDQMSHRLEEGQANETKLKEKYGNLRSAYHGLDSKYQLALQENKEEKARAKENAEHLQSRYAGLHSKYRLVLRKKNDLQSKYHDSIPCKWTNQTFQFPFHMTSMAVERCKTVCDEANQEHQGRVLCNGTSYPSVWVLPIIMRVVLCRCNLHKSDCVTCASQAANPKFNIFEHRSRGEVEDARQAPVLQSILIISSGSSVAS
eukprot:s706_g11.t1